jgi:ABC-type nickel/cobalt efflux system permease component RcnA
VFILATESWIPVLFAGLIPIAGAIAVLYLIVRAVRDNDEDSDEG